MRETSEGREGSVWFFCFLFVCFFTCAASPESTSQTSHVKPSCICQSPTGCVRTKRTFVPEECIYHIKEAGICSPPADKCIFYVLLIWTYWFVIWKKKRFFNETCQCGALPLEPPAELWWELINKSKSGCPAYPVFLYSLVFLFDPPANFSWVWYRNWCFFTWTLIWLLHSWLAKLWVFVLCVSFHDQSHSPTLILSCLILTSLQNGAWGNLKQLSDV